MRFAFINLNCIEAILFMKSFKLHENIMVSNK